MNAITVRKGAKEKKVRFDIRIFTSCILYESVSLLPNLVFTAGKQPYFRKKDPEKHMIKTQGESLEDTVSKLVLFVTPRRLSCLPTPTPSLPCLPPPNSLATAPSFLSPVSPHHQVLR